MDVFHITSKEICDILIDEGLSFHEGARILFDVRAKFNYADSDVFFSRMYGLFSAAISEWYRIHANDKEQTNEA